MKKLFPLLLLGLVSLPLVSPAQSPTAQDQAESPYEYRWVQINMDAPSIRGEVDRFRTIADAAAENGYNGLFVMGMWDALDIESIYVHKALREMRRIAEERGLDVIPGMLNIGYNSYLLKHNPNLAEGLPVKGALFVAGVSEARHVPEGFEAIENGGFEDGRESLEKLFEFDRELGSLDTQIVHDGKASLRFSNYTDRPALLRKRIAVQPNRLYRVRFWVRSDDTGKMSDFGTGRFVVNVLGEGKRQLSYFDPQVPVKTDWRSVEVAFNSMNYESIVLEVGVRTGGSGSFWLDDLEIEEIGMVNLLRRPGTPLIVRDEASGVVYEEGVDFARVEDTLLNYLFDHEGPSISLLPGSRIRPGTRLRVDYHHAVVIYQGQTPVCMSEPEVHQIWRRLAEVVTDTLGPRYYLLNTDEVRVAGSCEACHARGVPVARMLGETLQMQMQMIREVNPDAVFFTWSDMFDPHHNANQRENGYYLVSEDFHKAWEYLPREVCVVNWNSGRKRQSASFFNELGQPMILSGNGDDSLDRSKDWPAAVEDLGNVKGYLYTTWLDTYELLDDFARLWNR